MRETSVVLTSFRNAACDAVGVSAPRVKRVAFDLDLNPKLGTGYAQRSSLAARTVTVCPGVTCRFSPHVPGDLGGVRVITDPLLADGDRIRQVIQDQAAVRPDIRFDPLCNAHQVGSLAVPGLVEALHGAGTTDDACQLLACVIERGPDDRRALGA